MASYDNQGVVVIWLYKNNSVEVLWIQPNLFFKVVFGGPKEMRVL